MGVYDGNDLISRQAAIEAVGLNTWAGSRISQIPPSEPLVRCKDCKWFNDFGCAIRIVDESDKPKEDDFCSFAERRDNGD